MPAQKKKNTTANQKFCFKIVEIFTIRYSNINIQYLLYLISLYVYLLLFIKYIITCFFLCFFQKFILYQVQKYYCWRMWCQIDD